MKVRGRRVALLLAGALPLLADDNLEQQQSHEPQRYEQQESRQAQHYDVQRTDTAENDADNDVVPLSAVEAIHLDEFQIPPLTIVTATTADDDNEDADGAPKSLTVDENQESIVTQSQSAPEQHEEEIQVEVDDGDVDEGVKGNVNGSQSDQSSSESEHVILDSLSSVVGQLLDKVAHIELKESDHNPLIDSSDNNKTNVTDELVEVKETSEGAESQENQQEEHQTDASDTSDGGNNSEDIDEVVEIRSEESTLSDDQPEDQATEVVPTSNDTNATSPLIEDGQPSEVEEDNLIERVAVDYASKAAGALILEKSSSFKGTSNLLNEDKDKYAIAPCEDKKFVVVGLSEDILVKQIILANYERFSSRVKDFQVLGSQTMGKWVDLGTYTAKPDNGKQTFDLVEPAWARYIKFKFHTHFGSEYYCTLSQIRVHGSTMLQGFHEQWEDTDHEDDNNDPGEQVKASDSPEQPVDISNDDLRKNDSKSESTEPDIIPDASTTDERDSPCDATSDHEDCTSTNDEPGGIGQFRESQSLNNMLHGYSTDEELFSRMLDLIPQALDARPTESLTSPGRKNESDLKSYHLLSTAAIESSHRWSQVAADTDRSMVAGSPAAIETPKMSDAVEDFVMRLKHSLTGTKTGSELQPQFNKIVEAHRSVVDHSQVSENSISDTETEETTGGDKKTEEPKTIDLDSESAKSDKGAIEDPLEVVDDAATNNQESPREQTVESKSADTAARSVDLALARMLERLPSADCLSELDYAEFKAKVLASRKTPPGGPGTGGGAEKEPIFKKLTDEIKALHISLSAHDQFTKASVSCYQRVLLDLVADMERMRSGHEERLTMLEYEMNRSRNYSISGIATLLWRGLVFSYACTKYVLGLLFLGLSLSYDGAKSLWRHTMGSYLSTPAVTSFVAKAYAFLQEGNRVCGIRAIIGAIGEEQFRWLLPAILLLSAFCYLIMSRIGRTDEKSTKTVVSNAIVSSVQPAREGNCDDEVPSMVDDDTVSQMSSLRSECDSTKKGSGNKKNRLVKSGLNGSVSRQLKQKSEEADKLDEVPTIVDDE